jgi:hypothetical protein
MKLKLRLFFITGFLLALNSCDDRVSLANSKRLLVKGTIINQNNEAIVNAEIGIFARRNNEFDTPGLGFNGFGGELIARTASNSDGTFSLITLYPITQSFSVEVFGQEAFTKYSYKTDIKNFEPTDLTINVGNVVLSEKSEVTFNINRTNTTSTELQYRISHNSVFCREVFFEETLDEELTQCHETLQIVRTLDDNNPDDTIVFTSLVNSEITFSYSINGQPEQTEILTIDQADYEFNFNY